MSRPEVCDPKSTPESADGAWVARACISLPSFFQVRKPPTISIPSEERILTVKKIHKGSFIVSRLVGFDFLEQGRLFFRIVRAPVRNANNTILGRLFGVRFLIETADHKALGEFSNSDGSFDYNFTALGSSHPAKWIHGTNISRYQGEDFSVVLGLTSGEFNAASPGLPVPVIGIGYYIWYVQRVVDSG